MSARGHAQGGRWLALAGRGLSDASRRREGGSARSRALAAASRRREGGSAGLGLSGLLLLGCPGPARQDGGEPVTQASADAPAVPDPEFRRQAHAKAFLALREASLPALRRLDPVAAAEVEGTPLHPPGFGPKARAPLREALDEAQRQAEGLEPQLLSPEDGVVLRLLVHALHRGRRRLERPPWRDDPSAVVDAVEPYLHALRRRLVAGQCDDGCGLAELGPALEAGMAEVGAASPATLAGTRAELAALRRELPALGAHLPAGHAIATARPALEAALERIDARLARAVAALAAAPEQPWEQLAAPSEPEAWKRRPARWRATGLARALEEDEAYTPPPERLFELAELTVARLRAMQQRDAAREGATPEPVLARPFDAAACEAAWAPLRGWVREQAPELVAELDCAGAPWWLPAKADDAVLVRHLLLHGVVEPTRRARVAATGTDVALVRGRAAPLAQALTLEIAVAAGSGRATALQHALRQAHHAACLAAAAVWIHGELGSDDQLRARLDAHACGELEPLVAGAEAHPRAALRGLGLVLIGEGPADAAALDRYFWAPMGLVHDLALPPPPPVEVGPAVTIEELDGGDPAPSRLQPLEPGDAAP